MAAGVLVVPSLMPARDRNGRLVPGALFEVRTNRTTTRATVYSDSGLSVPLANPVVANSSGHFPAIWAEAGTTDDPTLYTVAIGGPGGISIANPAVFHDWQPSLDADVALLAIANSASETATDAADNAAQSYADIVAYADASTQPAAIAGKASKDANLSDLTDPAAARENIGADLAENMSVVQTGTGAVTRTVEGKLRDTLNAADFLPVGYVVDGSVDYTTQLQAAIDAATSTRRTLIIPAGTFKIVGSGLTITQPIRIAGQGNQYSWLTNSNGSCLTLEGQFIEIADVLIWSVTGGPTITQTALVAQAVFERVHLIQSADDYAVWDNNGHEYVDNRFAYSVLQHTLGSTVYAFNLVHTGGFINDNIWEHCRVYYSGTKHFFNIESTSANAQYSNHWEGITWEVCRGGGVRMRGCRRFSIDTCQNWDAGAGNIVNHFYDIDRNASLVTCTGTIRDCGRWAGSNAVAINDVKLPGGGGGAGIAIYDCETSGGGDPFTIDAANNAILFTGIVPTLMSFTNTAGLMGLDPLSGLMAAGVRVVNTRKTGWAVDTGTSKRTPNATYAAGATLTFSATYVQAELTALATRLALVETALQDATQTQKALKDDLHSTAGHGLLGP